MNIDESNGSTVLHRETEYKPQKSIQSWLIGRPLQTADAPHQTIGKLIGLAVFASDALSSTAYGPQEMLVILALAGAAGYQLSFPIAIGIAVLLLIVTLSYEQTIHAYPGGGGSYIVARDNLGEIPAQTAAASLLTDYILTVSVSISSGVAQIVSAAPDLYPYRVAICVGLIFFVMLINLRGVRESGIIFSIPSYFFVVMMYFTVIAGLYQYFISGLGVVVNPPETQMIGNLQGVTLFLILRAFSNGTSALTGVEAISNGITAFKEPRSKNAGITLIWMSSILGSLMLGIAFLSYHIGARPSELETVISQLARTVFQEKGIYLAVIASTTVILIMAANTAFADFPRLSAIAAADGFLPRQLAYRGSRLVYSRGIVALAVIASILTVIFQASVTNLIPLYAIGVFVSFSLSQAGMAHRWWKSGHLEPGIEIKERGSILCYEHGWQIKMVVNGFGAICTSVVAVVFAITKFSDGAWIVVILVPSLILIFSSIHHHYIRLAEKLSLDHFASPPRMSRHRVILPVGGVHRGTLAALRYAKSLSEDITAVHVSIDPVEAEKIRKKWEVFGDGVRLMILESPYRLFIEPLIEYIEEIDEHKKSTEMISIVVPQFISKNHANNLLHTNTADTLRKVLLFRPNIVISEVPYQVD